MKFIGQYIQSFIARFRNDVYLEDISTGTIASGAHLGLDSNNKIVKAVDGGGDLTSIVAGTGLSGTSLTGPIPTLNVDASIPEITTLAGLTSFGSAGASTIILAGDLKMLNAVNDGNPTISLGSSSANRFEIKTGYNSGAQTLDEVYFNSYTTSGATNDGRYIFQVDEVEIGRFLDTGLSWQGAISCKTGLSDTNATASSATEGGKLQLRADDGAAMGDDHRLGVIEFLGAEDASATRSIGARIQAICRDAWDGSNNDADLEFYTTNGTTESKVLTLDADKLATFTGAVTATGALSGTLATVSQPNITGVGTIGTGVWQGTAIASAYLDSDTAHLTTDQTFTGKKTFSDDVTFNCDNITFESANADDPKVTIKNTTDDNQAARLTFTKDRGAAMGDNDRVAEIDFIGEDASQNTQGYGKIMCQALESDHGVETGTVKIQVAEYDGTLTNGLVVKGGNADGVVDTTLGAGAASTTTVAGDLAVTTGLILDSVDVTAIQTATEVASSFGDNDTSLLTAAAIDDRIRVTSKHVLRCNSFYVNDVPLVQNSLYFGNSVGNNPWNWNDPAAVGGVIGDTSSFTIIGDDENWGIVLPMNISKIEVQCSLRPSLGQGDDFTLAVYTGVRSNDSAAALTLTKVGHQSVTLSSTNQNYTRNDLTVTGDYDKGTMIYVGVGSEDATDAKNARGYMNITVTER